MAMTLRLTETEDTELTEAAAREGKSKQQFILDAALDAARSRTRLRDDLILSIRTQRRDLLDRLGR